MAQDLQGKIILISGGAQGIGEAAACLCAERGALVYIADVERENGLAVVSGIRESGGQAEFLPLDVRDESQVRESFAFVREQQGRLDALVCAAGMFKGAFLSPEELTADDFQTVMAVNVTGVFLCVKYAAPLLEASGKGVLVVVGSGAGVSGPSSSLAYGASKGGVNGLSMTLEAHLAGRGIRVNTLLPGSIATEMKLSVEAENARRRGLPLEATLEQAKQHYGTPQGVAKIIAFMVSDDADYLRGSVTTR